MDDEHLGQVEGAASSHHRIEMPPAAAARRGRGWPQTSAEGGTAAMKSGTRRPSQTMNCRAPP
jgi:hypothetical protein